jgi:cyclophilin family peptidyl-prolyl cis-trans isomerase
MTKKKNKAERPKKIEIEKNVDLDSNIEIKEAENLESKNFAEKTKSDLIKKNTVNSSSKVNPIPKLSSTIVASTIAAILVIAGFSYFTINVIPNVLLEQTEEAKSLKKKKEDESASKSREVANKQKIEEENKSLTFSNRSVRMSFANFGDIDIELKDQAAPKTVENFVRLTYRGYYNNTPIHRIVETEQFNVIQGGDGTSFNGSGGVSSTLEPIVDELWAVEPEFDISNSSASNQGAVKNNPQFRDPSLYKDYNKELGTVTYRKGLILMAKTQAKNSATSQFFITLGDTTLPAEYTVFGTIKPETISTLEKITAEINPTPTDAANGTVDATDGKPDKDLKIDKVVLL